MSSYYQMSDEQHYKSFGILDKPIEYLKDRLCWEVERSKWVSLVDMYDSKVYDLVWDLHSIVQDEKHLIGQAMDVILTGRKIDPFVIREYLIALEDGLFTKQDGKDILSRLENGEQFSDIIIDEKYKKVNDIEQIVDKILIDFRDNILKSKDSDKIKKWLIGQVMKETKGKCDPVEVDTLIASKLEMIVDD